MPAQRTRLWSMKQDYGTRVVDQRAFDFRRNLQINEITYMEDELTTAMHEEFIGDEIPHFDLMVMAVYGAQRRGVPLKEALAKYGISEEEYRSNLDRVLNS